MSGRTTICLLPGLDGTGLLYRRLTTELQRDFETSMLTYDVHDCGYADLAKKLMPRLPMGRSYVLVAESFAGPLAILMAARRPAGLQAVVLAASFARTPMSGGQYLAALIDHLPLLRPPNFLLERLLMSGKRDVDLIKQLEESLAKVPLTTLKARVLAALRCDVSTELASLEVPLLYLIAKHDRLITRRSGEWIAQTYVNTKRECIDAPHFIFQLAAEAAAHSIRVFLSQHPSAADAYVSKSKCV